jgi:hypothetical protein
MGKECICNKAEQHNAAEIAHIESIHSLVGLDLEYDGAYENYLLNVNSSDGTEFKVKINYCPMCGRKLNEKFDWEPSEKLKELLR